MLNHESPRQKFNNSWRCTWRSWTSSRSSEQICFRRFIPLQGTKYPTWGKGKSSSKVPCYGMVGQISEHIGQSSYWASRLTMWTDDRFLRSWKVVFFLQRQGQPKINRSTMINQLSLWWCFCVIFGAEHSSIEIFQKGVKGWKAQDFGSFCIFQLIVYSACLLKCSLPFHGFTRLVYDRWKSRIWIPRGPHECKLCSVVFFHWFFSNVFLTCPNPTFLAVWQSFPMIFPRGATRSYLARR